MSRPVRSRRPRVVQVAIAGVTTLTVALLSSCGTGPPPPAATPSVTQLVAGNGSEHQAAVSADGNVVAFITTSSDLGFTDDNGSAPDVVVLDRATGQMTRVAAWGADGGSPGSPPSLASRTEELALSADGRHLAFRTNTAVLPDDTNGTDDIYDYDRSTDAFTRVSAGADGGPLRRVSISDDGSVIGFNRADAPTGYRYLRATGSLEATFEGGFVTVIDGGPLSSNGRFQVQSTTASWAPDDTDTFQDCYVRNLDTHGATRVPTPDTTIACRDAFALDDGGAVVSAIMSEGVGFAQVVVVWHPGGEPVSFPVPVIQPDSSVGPVRSGGVPAGVAVNGSAVTVADYGVVTQTPLTFSMSLDALDTSTGASTPIHHAALPHGSDTSATGRFVAFTSAAGHLQLWDRGS